MDISSGPKFQILASFHGYLCNFLEALAIDPFSFPDAMVVHYLINKNDVVKLAQEQEQKQQQPQQQRTAAAASTTANNNNNGIGGGVMRFVLFPPSSTSAGGQQQQIATSSDLVTNTGGIHAAISWSPNPLKPKNNQV